MWEISIDDKGIVVAPTRRETAGANSPLSDAPAFAQSLANSVRQIHLKNRCRSTDFVADDQQRFAVR